jgi:hypothetical protein
MMRQISSAMMLAALLIVGFPSLRHAAHAQSKPEEIEWTWEVRPLHMNALLPNVLLEGNSLTRNYFPEVQRELAGKASVYQMASSICVDHPRLPKEIAMFAKMEGVRFRVVHFNHGMHGWDYSEAQFEAGFPAYLAALHSIAPQVAFIWTTITPVRSESKPGPTNARIDARNAIAWSFVHDMMIDNHVTLPAFTLIVHTDGCLVEIFSAGFSPRRACT